MLTLHVFNQAKCNPLHNKLVCIEKKLTLLKTQRAADKGQLSSKSIITVNKLVSTEWPTCVSQCTFELNQVTFFIVHCSFISPQKTQQLLTCDFLSWLYFFVIFLCKYVLDINASVKNWWFTCCSVKYICLQEGRKYTSK